MSWFAISEESISCDVSHFTKAVEIWIHRPNVCCKMISCASVQLLSDTNDVADCIKLQEKVIDAIGSFTNECFDEKGFKFPVNWSDISKFYYRELIPRNPCIHSTSHEIMIRFQTSVFFVPVSSDFELDYNQVWYQLELSNLGNQKINQIMHCQQQNEGKLKEVKLKVLTVNATKLDEICVKYADMTFKKTKYCRPNEIWLKEKLMQSLVKWMTEPEFDSKQHKLILPPSLSMIPQREYAEKYQDLKQKYGSQMIKVWNEVTDPQKYIYEDVAIATYLILLWKKERESTAGRDQLQSFIDLGCGNGLLVHILNSEGHPGKGIDVRRRNIWDVYPSTTNLVEGTVDPTSDTLFSEFDWLLGNHSDELTPWIPVLAARSGYNVRYWVLPCCFFDFFTKYERIQSTLGQYDDYLKFVETVGQICGFNVDIDVMRIPSTKRVCHIGMRKSYSEKKHPLVLKAIEEYIDSRRFLSLKPHFQARDKVDKVRNCTKMDRSIQELIVSLITNKLLSEKNIIRVENAENTFKDWNKGGSLSLEDAVLLLSNELRKKMKSECGGLQTLLRNHHQIFLILNGRVQIRDWSALVSTSGKKKKESFRKQTNPTKTKSCWFFKHHPDGCPKIDEACTFLH